MPVRGKSGRPKREDAPDVPWNEVDRILVFGEFTTDEKTGKPVHRYPTFRELGKRYGCSLSLIGHYASKHGCIKRRHENRIKEQIEYENQVIRARAKARAVSTEDAVQIIDDYLSRFDEALKEGRVRFDSPSDFNTMVRLKEFVQGRADSRQQVQGTLTLDDIQVRHRQLQDQIKSLDAKVSGMADEEKEPASQTESKDGDGDATDEQVLH